MVFTGQAEATIDAKDRLALPAKFRARWNPERDGATWYCVPWPAENVLRLYTERIFDELYANSRSSPTLIPSSDEAELQTALFSLTEQMDVDASWRVKLSKKHRELVAMPNEVVVIGAGDRLEVRSRDVWNATQAQRFADLERIAARVARTRTTPPASA